jgi:hypothetical protein
MTLICHIKSHPPRGLQLCNVSFFDVSVRCNLLSEVRVFHTSSFVIQGVPGVKVTTSGFNSRADFESKMSYTRTCGPNWQRFRGFEF